MAQCDGFFCGRAPQNADCTTPACLAFGVGFSYLPRRGSARPVLPATRRPGQGSGTHCRDTHTGCARIAQHGSSPLIVARIARLIQDTRASITVERIMAPDYQRQWWLARLPAASSASCHRALAAKKGRASHWDNHPANRDAFRDRDR